MSDEIVLVKDHPDYKNIDEIFLKSLIDDPYVGRKSKSFFRKSLTFYAQVKNRDVKTLSDKQKNWLWELSCIIHDRKSNKEEVKTEQKIIEVPVVQKTFIQKVIHSIKKIIQA